HERPGDVGAGAAGAGQRLEHLGVALLPEVRLSEVEEHGGLLLPRRDGALEALSRRVVLPPVEGDEPPQGMVSGQIEFRLLRVDLIEDDASAIEVTVLDQLRCEREMVDLLSVLRLFLLLVLGIGRALRDDERGRSERQQDDSGPPSTASPCRQPLRRPPPRRWSLDRLSSSQRLNLRRLSRRLVGTVVCARAYSIHHSTSLSSARTGRLDPSRSRPGFPGTRRVRTPTGARRRGPPPRRRRAASPPRREHGRSPRSRRAGSSTCRTR